MFWQCPIRYARKILISFYVWISWKAEGSRLLGIWHTTGFISGIVSACIQPRGSLPFPLPAFPLMDEIPFTKLPLTFAAFYRDWKVLLQEIADVRCCKPECFLPAFSWDFPASWTHGDSKWWATCLSAHSPTRHIREVIFHGKTKDRLHWKRSPHKLRAVVTACYSTSAL